MKFRFSTLNEYAFASKEVSSIGAGSMSLLRGGAAKTLNFIGRCIAYTSTRAYGFFFLAFGIMSLLLNFGEYYFLEDPDVSFYHLIIGFALALFSIPFLIFDKPICTAFQDFWLTEVIFFEFLSIKRMHKNVEHASVPELVALFLGFIPAVFGFFFSIEWVLLSMIVGTVAVISFTSPEFPLILTVLLLPYLSLIPYSTSVICTLSVLTFASYALKVILGKRVYSFDIYSAVLLIILMLVFISGVMAYGWDGFFGSLVFMSLLISYIPTANMISNRRLTECVFNAVIISAIPIAFVSVAEFFYELSIEDKRPHSAIKEGVSAFFESSAALAAFTLVTAILALYFAANKFKKSKKIYYSAVFLLEVAVLGLLLKPEIWLVMLLLLLAYPMVKSRSLPMEALLAPAVLPYFVYLLPAAVLGAISEVFTSPLTFTERVDGYSEAFEIFSGNIIFGVGAGDGGYVAAGGSRGGGVYNTALGLAVEFGIFVLAFAVIVLLLRLRHISYYRRYTRGSAFAGISFVSTFAVLALVFLGAFDSLFSDPSVAYLFFTLFAINGSALRGAKKENDDRLGYYGDASSSEYSALDVSVSR